MTAVDEDAPRLRPGDLLLAVALGLAGWGLLALAVWGLVREMM